MFDHQISDPIIIHDPHLVTRWPVIERQDQNDVINAIIALTGAAGGCLLSHSSSLLQETELAAIFGNPSSLPGLGGSPKSWQADVQRVLEGSAHGGKPIWLNRGYDYLLCVALSTGENQFVHLVLCYLPHMLATGCSDMERRVMMIVPLIEAHLRAASELADVSRKFAGAMSLLHASNIGIILFDNQGHMIIANDTARSTFDAQDGLRMGNRAPVPLSLKDATRLQLALEHQIADNAAGRMGRRKSTVLLIRRQNGRRPFVATLIAVPASASKVGDPAVMMYLFDPSQERMDHLSAICELYGLSQVEARLAHHLATGKTVDSAADAMRIKSPTARTYLKQIFSKTGTHRQTELVRLLLLSTGRINSQALPEALC